MQRFDKSMKAMEKGESTKVGIKEYMGFRIFQNISRDVKEYLSADYQFYQGKEYYQPTKVGFLTKAVTGIMLRVIFFMMRDMGPGEKKR